MARVRGRNQASCRCTRVYGTRDALVLLVALNKDSGNVLTILWTDLTIKGNDLAWNDLTME